MNKSLIVSLVVGGVLVIGGGSLYLATRDNASNEVASNTSSVDAMEKKDTSSDSTDNKSEEVMVKDDTAMKKDDSAMAKASAYVTLSDFNKDPGAYSTQKKVYFFHASWCPICQSIDADISSDTSQIPNGTTFIKTDFDSNTSLRQKYGVTTQYTFVQVDNDGNELKQWSATTLDKAIAGIQ